MIQIIGNKTKIDFIGKRKVALGFSCFLLAIGLISLAIRGGFNVGIDFSGGTMIQILFEKEVKIDKLRDALEGVGMADSEIQHIGKNRNELIIRTKSSKNILEDAGSVIKKIAKDTFPGNGIDIRRIEMVGPKVGKDLRRKGLLSFIYAMAFMLVYIWWRFELSFGVGAVLALMHDIALTLGFLSLFNVEFDLKIVAALLTVVGYSINDTIVVYDRIRENLKLSKRETYAGIVNKSINQTLSRTLLTSMTTFIVVAILFLFGGEVIHGFSFVLLAGILTGTYSSIYVASPIVLMWEKKPAKRLTTATKS